MAFSEGIDHGAGPVVNYIFEEQFLTVFEAVKKIYGSRAAFIAENKVIIIDDDEMQQEVAGAQEKDADADPAAVVTADIAPAGNKILTSVNGTSVSNRLRRASVARNIGDFSTPSKSPGKDKQQHSGSASGNKGGDKTKQAKALKGALKAQSKIFETEKRDLLKGKAKSDKLAANLKNRLDNAEMERIKAEKRAATAALAWKQTQKVVPPAQSFHQAPQAVSFADTVSMYQSVEAVIFGAVTQSIKIRSELEHMQAIQKRANQEFDMETEQLMKDKKSLKQDQRKKRKH